MTSPAFDASELRALSADLRSIDERLARHVYPIVERGAVNIKKAMQEDMKASRHFKGAAGSISYDIHQTSFAGTGVYEAVIGPDKARRGGALGNIAYFGTSRGGGTVRDPAERLAEELPRFEKAILDELGDLL